MLEQLRGRNLAHVGCTFGLLSGLIVGLIAAIVFISVFSSPSSSSWAALLWLAITGVMGIAGYWLGSWSTQRLWGTQAATTERRDD
ncbi:MAG: hypothetical protein ACHQ4H_02720 [Ktedonobacterales bacterium]